MSWHFLKNDGMFLSKYTVIFSVLSGNDVKVCVLEMGTWLEVETWAAQRRPFPILGKKIFLARLVIFLAIPLCFSARGRKINNIEKS